jgi:hypothetical protein
MAIVRSAGTEIIRSVSLEHVTDTATPLIVGVQHHIYTVLSVIIYNNTIAASGNNIMFFNTAFDAYGGASGQAVYIFNRPTGAESETFVWNDKFSFNGFEPDWSGASGAMTTAAEQDLIADQGGGTAQTLMVYSSNNNNKIDVHCTYIDQNNA